MPSTAATDRYILGHHDAEKQRLLRQGEAMSADTGWLFDRLEPLDGRRVVEIGCGPRGFLDVLSSRVGRQGRVVGVDRSEEAVDAARRFVAGLNLTNVEVIKGDGRSVELPRESFDIAAGRLVLVNVPAPEEVVREAVALIRPGGVVAWHEADWGLNICDPPLAAWDRVVELFTLYAGANGVDLLAGRRLPRLLREAGLTDVKSRVIVNAYEPRHPARSVLLDFLGNLEGRFVAAGLVDTVELEVLRAALASHIEDPETYVISHLFVQAWGRKPT
jgi:SAM-dependent methyltransferase